MSGTVPLTVGGGYNGVSGAVTIPSSLLFGTTTGGSINDAIQTYLGTVSNAVTKGNTFINSDLAGVSTYSVAGAGRITYETFTNMDSTGASAAGAGSYDATVAAGVTDLTVQVPGDVTLTGVSSTSVATFGAQSNVNYSVTDPTAGTMLLAGGNDSITFYATSTNNAETVQSAGNDTVNFQGQGTDFVTVYDNGTIQIGDANAYVAAEGSATTNLFWDSANAGGTLHFVNNSSVGATIHIGNFNGATSSTKVTAYGGVGGGYYVGGSSGSNSLVGGSGVVTLVGAGPGDFLEAQSSLGTNIFVAGSDGVTMVATSTTGSNVFGAGLNYPGGSNPPSSGVISTAGSGSQQFLLGNVPEGLTVVGSTAATASNTYFIVSDATAGGGLYSLYNFIDSRSAIILSDGNGGAGSASIVGMGADQFNGTQYDIALSDGTSILLKGLSSAQMANISVFHAGSITGIVG
jgi:hypothetical protein